MKKKYFFEVRIRLRSFNITSLEILKQKLKNFADSKGLDYFSINLPVKKKKITVLKSPHVNKKAKDQFEIPISNRLVVLKGSKFDWDLYNKLHKISLEDVSTKLIISRIPCLN